MRSVKRDRSSIYDPTGFLASKHNRQISVKNTWEFGRSPVFYFRRIYIMGLMRLCTEAPATAETQDIDIGRGAVVRRRQKREATLLMALPQQARFAL
jgi:hypothetical protein